MEVNHEITIKTNSSYDMCFRCIDGTTANIKKYFTDKITIGSYVRLYLRSYGHSFIVTDITDTGISVYDCNYVGPCEVDMRNLTWADIKSKFTYIVNAYCY